MAINQTARQLGQFMKRMRDRAGVSAYAIEADQIINARTLGRAEKGESLLNWPTWEAIGKKCGATPDELDHIEQMARKAGEKGWWEEHKGGMPPKFQRFVSLEADAARMDIMETEVITGLFQTVDYMRGVLAVSPFLDPAEIPAKLAFRERRAVETVDRDNPPVIRLVLTEGALLREVANAEAHARQLEHLQALAERPNIEIRVLRHSAGAYPTSGAYTIVEFEDNDDADTVYLESSDGGRYVENPDVVGRYRTIFRAAFDRATPLQEYFT